MIDNNKMFTFPFIALAMNLGVSNLSEAANKSKKPNIIWYLIEDTSPQFLAMYNNGLGAQTPNLEKLSKDMIIYDNAYSNAPVSSAARTTLITGCYAPRFGGSLHRRIDALKMPEGLRMVPSYLREEGYYTLNISKTDYNVELDESAWDLMGAADTPIDSWKEREDKSQPFFFMRSNLTTHESKLLFDSKTYRQRETKNDPEKSNIHPNLPETDLMKYSYATFYDQIEKADAEFGQLIEMLRAEGELDNTFIFFFGDNGGCVAQSKGYSKDVGFHVPLMVYVPESWRKKIDYKGGEHIDDMVQFIDFGATAMNLAGVDVPKQSNGQPFLGKGAQSRESILCYADRFDELYSFNRSLYRDNFRYGRNFIPYHTRSLHTFYRYRMLALQQTRNMYKEGELNDLQSEFFEPLGAEELYDLKNDPNETRNLAKDPAYRAQLQKMRSEIVEKMDNYCDLGFLPETIIYEKAMANPATYGKEHQQELSGYHKIANLQLESCSATTIDALVAAMESNDDVAKWWGVTSAASFGEEIAASEQIISFTKKLTERGNRSFLRSRSYIAIANYGLKNQYNQRVLLDILKDCKTLAEVMLVLNDAAYMHETGFLAPVSISADDLPFIDDNIYERIAYLRTNV